MSNGKCVLAFVIGAGIGSAVTWKLLKTKYEQIAQEEIDSVKEHFRNRARPQTEVKETTDVEEEVEETDYAERTREYSYAGDVERSEKAPYVIHPDIFGTREDYECRSLKCFRDRVVTDTDNEIIDDVDNLIGDESLDHFGEFEMDSVFVRNERLKCDYEILLDPREYSDVMKEMSHQVED
jgi:hypothetical protein